MAEKQSSCALLHIDCSGCFIVLDIWVYPSLYSTLVLDMAQSTQSLKYSEEIMGYTAGFPYSETNVYKNVNAVQNMAKPVTGDLNFRCRDAEMQ